MYLNVTGSAVVFGSNDIGVHNTGGGIQRIHSWINTQFSDTTGKHGGGVKMGKSGGRSGICQVVGWHINSLKNTNNFQSGKNSDMNSLLTYLHRSNWSFLSGGDAFLHGTHVSGQGGLVTHGRWNTTKQGRHLK